MSVRKWRKSCCSLRVRISYRSKIMSRGYYRSTFLMIWLTTPHTWKLFSSLMRMAGKAGFDGTRNMALSRMAIFFTVKSPSTKHTAMQPSWGVSDLSIMRISPSPMPLSIIELPVTRAQNVASGVRISCPFLLNPCKIKNRKP